MHDYIYIQNLCPHCMSTFETFLFQVSIYELLGMHVSICIKKGNKNMVFSVFIFNEAFILR